MTRWVEETLHPNFRCALKADRVLYENQTEHQHLIIFDNETFGRVMMLDGVVQLSTTDEFIYHEMMSHVPLFSLGAERAKRVLIIGGGDGGVMREVLKHKSVERCVLVDIDRTVVDLSKEHLPEVSQGAFDDPRAEVIIADGVKYVAETDERFDAIIVDSTEPVGPAAVLFTRGFFEGCARALNKPGVLITQNGLPFMHPDHLRGTMELFSTIFADRATYLVDQPTYFGGPFALAWASNDTSLRDTPLDEIAKRHAASGIPTRYYTPDVHKAAFALPGYVAKLSV
ncbi:polyamine aminopropyltransferase [Rhodomicrobium vannielii ATCC 17100]|uniref:Polyamine aminopropyltransferase n=1 Tax=Rhodomicrobium udaipurense TaxID=1202716 RepID=A0A8I1KKK8_9HYPH|nr:MULTISPECIES: polyamine aminopropyltransferase [Rhodomicrobium]KAI96110.1 spermidine synthase [Rhodomicrobium udaipurense JA643]MBJ7534939.1 polyamine aminopropyltransferase [Rhodomicrobium vannielii ATCC 17100]MBJ7544194.1 polyamine aminopropyltransferase [Rhodomicrobium udaipurense]